jgi:Fe2+ transport system protein B
MAKECPQCKKENPGAASFCMFCGILLNLELPKCHKCKEEHTEIADFCLHCGYAITEKAKTRQKNTEKKMLRELKEKNEILRNQFFDEQKSKKELEDDLQKEIKKSQKENELLKATIEKIKEENNKRSNTNEKELIIPKFVFVIFCIVAIIFLLFLFIHNGK